MGLAVIEDAAQAHGARFDSASAPDNSATRLHSVSFPGKNLGAWGDAGAVVCNDAEIAGSDRLSFPTTADPTSSRTSASARILVWTQFRRRCSASSCRHLDDWNSGPPASVAGWYDDLLATHERMRPDRMQSAARCRSRIPPLYVIQVPDRDRIRTASYVQAGITTGIHYPIPVHEQPAYRHLVPGPDSLPVTHELCKRILSLPMHPEITRPQVERVVETLSGALATG